MTKDDLADEPRQAVLDCQHRSWLALQHRDKDIFTEVLAEEFICRSPGQEDHDRPAFVAALTSTPLTILEVSGEAIAIYLLGDVAVLTGTQIAQLHVPGGEMVSQQLALTNIFQHKADDPRTSCVLFSYGLT